MLFSLGIGKVFLNPCRKMAWLLQKTKGSCKALDRLSKKACLFVFFGRKEVGFTVYRMQPGIRRDPGFCIFQVFLEDVLRHGGRRHHREPWLFL